MNHSGFGRRLADGAVFLTLMAWMAGAVAMETAEPPKQPKHKVVYQCHRGEPEAYASMLFSVSQMKERYGDDIDIVVVCFGPGIHLLAKKPKRPVPLDLREKLNYLDMYGVHFQACTNTMNALGWGEDDMLDVAKVIPVGADQLMTLQEAGYAYIAW